MTDHPLRPIRKMVDEILKEMSPQLAKLCSEIGAHRLRPNDCFGGFVGMEMDETVWNNAVFSKNQERLLNEKIAESFFQRVLERARPYLSDEHLTVDGTLKFRPSVLFPLHSLTLLAI